MRLARGQAALDGLSAIWLRTRPLLCRMAKSLLIGPGPTAFDVSERAASLQGFASWRGRAIGWIEEPEQRFRPGLRAARSALPRPAKAPRWKGPRTKPRAMPGG